MSIADYDLRGSEWNNIRTLFTAYFNQDFDIMYGTPDDTIRAFKGESSPSVVDQTRHEVETLMVAAEDDAELEAAFRKLGLGYYPPADRFTNTAWLQHVLEVLAERP